MPEKLNLSLKSIEAKLVNLKDSVLQKKNKLLKTQVEKLDKATDGAVDELEKEGKTEEAKKLREEAAAVQKDPSKVGEFNKKVKRLKLSKKVENELIRLSARIEVAFGSLKDDFENCVYKIKKKREESKTKKKHEESETKSKFLNYFKAINGIAESSNQLLFFEPLMQGKGFQVNESNLVKLIPKKVEASKLNSSALLSVREWVNDMLESAKNINKKLEKEVKHCNGLSDKEKIIKYLARQQVLRMSELIKVLKLPVHDKYESSSLGKIANNPECKKLIGDTVELLEGNKNKSENYYREIVS